MNMSWRNRRTENELPILRGLIDEIICILDDHSSDADLIETINKAIWECNNAPLEDYSPIWWPRHEEIDCKIFLIVERLDADKNPIEMRVRYEYEPEEE